MISNEEIGNRIKEIRIKKNISLDDVASYVGVAKSTIQRYENGKINKIKIPVINSIADALKVNPSWLVGKSESPDIKISPQPVRIPVLGRIAAGIPISAVQEIIDWEEIPSQMASTGDYFALQIRGDSMEPKISNGDVVICRQQSDADDGDLVIALVNGNDAVCKRLKKYQNGMISLLSTNPAYEPLIFTGSEIDNTPVRIIGIVKELRAKF